MIEDALMIDAQLLERAGPFAGANAGSRHVLERGATTHVYATGSTLFTAGSEARAMFVIIDGAVRVVRAAGGRQHVIHTEGAGGVLGDVPLFESLSNGGGALGRYPATALAARRTRCLVVGGPVLAAALSHDPTLALHFLDRLARRVRGLVERLDRLAARDATARLAAWLLEHDGRGDASSSLPRCTQEELAEELGTVREVVVRGLRRMREAGAIASVGRGTYRVADVAMLEHLAGRSAK